MTSGLRAAVSSETRAPPEPPAITVGPEVEVAQQRAERVGLHLRLRRAAEHDRRRTAVRAVPREHPPAGVGEGLRHLGEPADVVGEPAAGREHPRLALTHELVGDLDPVQLCDRHSNPPSGGQRARD